MFLRGRYQSNVHVPCTELYGDAAGSIQNINGCLGFKGKPLSPKCSNTRPIMVGNHRKPFLHFTPLVTPSTDDLVDVQPRLPSVFVENGGIQQNKIPHTRMVLCTCPGFCWLSSPTVNNMACLYFTLKFLFVLFSETLALH